MNEIDDQRFPDVDNVPILILLTPNNRHNTKVSIVLVDKIVWKSPNNDIV